MLKKVSGVGVIILMLLAATDVALFYFNPTFPKKVRHAKEISVAEGSSLSAVSDLLAGHQLIRNRFYFRILGQWAEKDLAIRPGLYAFHTGMRPTEILDYLVSGRVLKVEVTFRKGLTSADMALLLEREGIIPASAFLDAVHDPELLEAFDIEADNFEGYLFPDTYTFNKKEEPRRIIRQMVGTFNERFPEEWRREAKRRGMTRHDVVTLASIIEKEIAMEGEAPRVSAVFHNRLKLGMRLQSDPTVIFGIPDFNGNLTRRDLMTETPYNTYRIPGLPPGPISNPGTASLRAALFPEDVNYLYFVSMNNGRHKFSETLEEHNAAVNMFQRGIPEMEMFDD